MTVLLFHRAYCPKCKQAIECCSKESRTVKAIECIACKRQCLVMSKGNSPLKGVVQGIALYMEPLDQRKGK